MALSDCVGVEIWRGNVLINAVALQAPAARAARPASRARTVVVRASAQETGKQLAAAALASALVLGAPGVASADIAGLTPCSESKAYAKRLKNVRRDPTGAPPVFKPFLLRLFGAVRPRSTDALAQTYDQRSIDADGGLGVAAAPP